MKYKHPTFRWYVRTNSWSTDAFFAAWRDAIRYALSLTALLLLFMLCVPSSHAQTIPSGGLDDFGGWLAAPGPANPNTQSATCSRSGTTITCTVSNGSVYWSANGGERIRIFGCGNTAMNYVFANDSNYGAPHITNIVSNTVTLTTDGASGTIASTPCSFAPNQFTRATISGPGSCNGPRLITPEGNCFVAESMTYPGCTTGFGNCSATKYGGTNTNCTGWGAEVRQWKTWNLNSVGLLNGITLDPSAAAGCNSAYTRVPFFTEIFISQYAMTATFNYGPNPILNVAAITGPKWASACGFYRPSADYYSPALVPFVQDVVTRDSSGQFWPLSPGFMGWQFDDTGGGNNLPNVGPDFHVLSLGGGNDCDTAMMTLLSAPSIQGTVNLLRSDGQVTNCNGSTSCLLYPDPENYSKAALESQMQTKYTTIGALNTAWGTSYTTFGSSGTTVTNEAYGTGTGSQTVFAHTLASHSSVSVFSVSVSVNGVKIGFDCPSSTDYWQSGCSASTGTGVVYGTTLSSGTINYSTGAMSITFASAPANGAAITVSYVQNGWCHGTGFLDECGNSTSVGTQAIGLLQKPAWASGTYTAGDIIHDATSCSWQVDVTPGTNSTGASVPSFLSECGGPHHQGNHVTDNQITWESEGCPVSGSEACSDFSLPDMNQTMASDLENTFLVNNAATFYQATCGTLKSEFPGTLCGGTDQTSAWFTPSRKGVLQAIASNVDWITYNGLDPTQDPNALGKYMFMTRWGGASLPIIDAQQFYTNSQNQTFGGPIDTVPVFSTIHLMGQAWFTLQQWLTSTVGANGTNQWAGVGWGGSHNIVGCQACGLKDNKDNAYDGHENVVSVVACSAPNVSLNCGGETTGAWIGQDAIGTATNGLILNANCLATLCGQALPSNGPVAPAPAGFAVNLSSELGEAWDGTEPTGDNQ